MPTLPACDPPMNSSAVVLPCSPTGRVAEDTASEASGKMQANTVVLMVVSMICFCLLLLGFYLVARRKAQTPIVPAGNAPLRTNATATHPPRLPQWRSDIRELWAGWLPNNSQPSARPPRPPSTRRPKYAQSGATSSFASSNVAPSVVEHCRCASYDLDHELTKEMDRISCGGMQAGHPPKDSSASGQRGYVEAVPNIPESRSRDATASPHGRHGACNVQGDSRNDGGSCLPWRRTERQCGRCQ